jgi:hypothetical protein
MRASGVDWGEEVCSMDSAWHIRARITPWDDPSFVRAYEAARQAVEAAGTPYGARGPAVELALRSAGYPDCRVTVERTVNEALEHRARWDVRRDG